MILRSKEGKTLLSYHAPNRRLPDGSYEHLSLLELCEENGTLRIV